MHDGAFGRRRVQRKFRRLLGVNGSSTDSIAHNHQTIFSPKLTQLSPFPWPMASNSNIDIEGATQHLRDILKLDRPVISAGKGGK